MDVSVDTCVPAVVSTAADGDVAVGVTDVITVGLVEAAVGCRLVRACRWFG